MDPDLEHAAGDLWVFGYGSLMWRPGFDFHERIEARLTGAHRALCVYSFVHRGTPERPGLVLGLDRGGACQGIAFRVAAADRAKTIAYLRAREQATGVYRECVRRVSLKSEPGSLERKLGSLEGKLGSPKSEPARQVPALCYVVDRSHVQYAGRLPLAEQLHYIRQGHGQSGPNRDYVLATVAAMEALGLRESELHLLAERLKGTHEGAG
jgi:cation transport protein ChaC